MIFNSPLFIAFLSIVVVGNYYLSSKHRSTFLLFASFLFIGYFNIESLWAILLYSLFNFYLAKKLHENRLLFIIGIIINSSAMLLFNLWHFSTSTIDISIEHYFLALGVMFYSLQNIAYLSDVYFKRSEPINNMPGFMLSTAFFPKIMSGPITSSIDFIQQLKSNNITKEMIAQGLNLFLVGLFKKMVIADRLAPAVQSIFDSGESNYGITTLAGVYIFTFQLYFDFSGYSNMAIGAGKMLGFNLPKNFHLPFRATSIGEFWRRWHISLITWLTNYLYYPIVFRMRSYKKIAPIIGIIIIFLISGIWHGITATFFIWALCHTLYLMVELFTKRYRIHLSKRIPSTPYNILSGMLVFNAVAFANIFFRASSFENALQLIQNIYTDFIPENLLRDFVAPLALGGHQIEQFNILVSIFFTLALLLFEHRVNDLANRPKLSITFMTIILLLIALFGVFDSGEQFIYMQL